MLQEFLKEGDWFRPKRYGYGSGLPIAWQGWAVLAAHFLVVIGLALWATVEPGLASTAVAAVGTVMATAVLVIIVRRRTRGGWRWRDGTES